MKYNALHDAGRFSKLRRNRKRWQKVVSVMASIVVFCTTYALILPAITMEQPDTYCGLENHIHGPECYEKVLTCDHASDDVVEATPMANVTEGHTHDETCYEEIKNLICEQEEVVGHKHDSSCETLICSLEETSGHSHGDACYEIQYETKTWTEEVTVNDGEELTCTSTEEGHAHDGSCYTAKSHTETVEHTEQVEVGRTLTCTTPESAPHSHDASCYQMVCTQEEVEGHTHDDACYTVEQGELICEIPEVTEAPETTDPAEPAHEHSDACYEEKLICGCEIEHEHTADCYIEPPYEPADDEALVCELEEHKHNDACLIAETGELICDLDEHSHDENCYEQLPAFEMWLPLDADIDLDVYTEKHEYIDEDGLYGVTVYAKPDTFDLPVTLEVELLEEDDDRYVNALDVLAAQVEETEEAEEEIVDEAADELAAIDEVTPENTLPEEPAEPTSEAPVAEEEVVEDEVIEEEITAQPALTGEEGMIAFDIHFVDEDGDEVQPLEPVYVHIQAMGLLPEDVDLSTVTVQHIREEQPATFWGRMMDMIPFVDETVYIPEVVADMIDEDLGWIDFEPNTDDDEIYDVNAAFEVDGFSVFTITYRNGNQLEVHVVDENGEELPENIESFATKNITGTSTNLSWRTIDSFRKTDVGLKDSYTASGIIYEYSGAYTSETLNTAVTYIRYRNSYWWYGTGNSQPTNNNGNGYTSELYLVYTATKATEIVIRDDIVSNGSLTAVLDESLDLENATVSYTWYKASAPEVNAPDSYAVVSGVTDKEIPVYEDGWRTYYYVVATVTTAEGDTTEYQSAAYQVPYYNTLQNGSFEEPEDSVMDQNGIYTGACWQGPEETEGLIWKTTGDLSDNRDIEIVDPFDSNSHDSAYHVTATNNLTIPVGGRYTGVADGERFAELNCEAWGALYQDVLTVPGSTLYWSFMHRGRYETDTMQLIIQSADGAMVEAGETFSVEQGAQADSEGNIEFEADDTAWVYHSGSYVVPEGQYVTRFYFVSTKATSSTEGNFLDKITFDFEIPEPEAEKGNLTVTKVVEGISSTKVPSRTFTFTVTGGDVNETFHLPTAGGQWSYTLLNLDPEVEYTVTEATPYAISGATYNKTLVGTTETMTTTASVPEGATGEVVFTNVYGELETNAYIDKQFVGPDGTTPVEAPAALDHIVVTLRQYYLKENGGKEYLDGSFSATLRETAETGKFTGEIVGAQPYTKFEVVTETLYDAENNVLANNADWSVASIIWNYDEADVDSHTYTVAAGEDTFVLSNTQYMLVSDGDGTYTLYMPTAPAEAMSDIVDKLEEVLSIADGNITVGTADSVTYSSNGQATITFDNLAEGTAYITGSFSFNQVNSVSAILLTNKVKYGTLQLTKEIALNNGATDIDENAEFTFNIYFPAAESAYEYATDDSKPWLEAKTYPVVYSDGTNGTLAVNEVSSTDTKYSNYGYYVTVTLKHGETATINNLPAGAEVDLMIEEEATPGYSTSYTGNINGGKTVGAIAYTGGFIGELVDITCTNTTGYALPSTGGIGTTLYTMSGMAMMSAALVGGYGLRRKRERGSEE